MLRRTMAWTCIGICIVLTGWMLMFHLKSVPAVYLVPSSGASLRRGQKMDVPWPNGSVNPNEASIEELDRLSGIGPVTAANIVEERNQHGDFVFPEDLLSVKGIGPATLQSLWQDLCLPLP